MITSDAYILITVHLVTCSVVFEALRNQNIHSLFPCNLFAAGDRTGETTQTTGANKAAVVKTKSRQTVDEIHVQQSVSTVGDG